MSEWKVAEENKRVLEIDGQEFGIHLDRSVGLWDIKPFKGPLPAALQSRFTTPAEASRAITNYVASRDLKKVA